MSKQPASEERNRLEAEISRLHEINGELLLALKNLLQTRSRRADAQARAAVARAEAK